MSLCRYFTFQELSFSLSDFSFAQCICLLTLAPILFCRLFPQFMISKHLPHFKNASFSLIINQARF